MKLSHQASPGEVAQAVRKYGFAFAERWQKAMPTREVAMGLGSALTLGKADVVHTIIPKETDTPNTYSGMYGMGDFPMHTDMAHWRDPPRFMLLRCVRGHEGVATLVADSCALVDDLGAPLLLRALVKPRRPVAGAFHLLSLYRERRSNEAALFRWDEAFLVPASKAGAEGMAKVRQALVRITRIHVPLAQAGDTLVVDNWRMVHGRSAVSKEEADRLIERAYLRELHD